jgi:hypothetical protein
LCRDAVDVAEEILATGAAQMQFCSFAQNNAAFDAMLRTTPFEGPKSPFFGRRRNVLYSSHRAKGLLHQTFFVSNVSVLFWERGVNGLTGGFVEG